MTLAEKGIEMVPDFPVPLVGVVTHPWIWKNWRRVEPLFLSTKEMQVSHLPCLEIKQRRLGTQKFCDYPLIH